MHILRAGKKAIAKSITKTLLWLNLNVCSLTAKTCFSKSVCYIMKNSVCRGIRGIVSLLKPPFLVGSFSTAQKQLRQSKVCIFLQFQRGILSVSAIKVCSITSVVDLLYGPGFFNTSYKNLSPIFIVVPPVLHYFYKRAHIQHY